MVMAAPGAARRLYRRLLRLHRALPPALRDLGDRYVKEEFRRHRAAGPAEAQRFLREWEASARRPAGEGQDRPGPPGPLQRLVGTHGWSAPMLSGRPRGATQSRWKDEYRLTQRS
ncbi:hypothetical protein BTVI_45013 [Pitangus sulphuratus]|nr:hypothetical protein BTVI_45013 [Pitangus sulphuratus]